MQKGDINIFAAGWLVSLVSTAVQVNDALLVLICCMGVAFNILCAWFARRD